MSVAVTPEKLGREFFEKNPRPSGRGAVRRQVKEAYNLGIVFNSLYETKT